MSGRGNKKKGAASEPKKEQSDGESKPQEQKAPSEETSKPKGKKGKK